VVLSHGQVVFDGATEQAIGRMHEIMQSESRDRRAHLLQEGSERAQAGLAEVEVDLVDEAGARQRTFVSGGEIVVRVIASFDEEVRDPLLGVMVAPLGLGSPAYTSGTGRGAYRGVHGPGRPLEAEIRLDNRLLAGGYSVTVALHESDGSRTLGASQAESFYVTSVGVQGGGLVDLDADISICGTQVEAPARSRLGGPQTS
jgi:hypothetical protein